MQHDLMKTLYINVS